MTGVALLARLSSGWHRHVCRQHPWVPGALASLLTVLALGAVITPANAAGDCGGTVTPAKEPSRQINLVLDESGSMFFDLKTGEPIDRWSFAKYSLEVFAAFMGPEDVLKVYKMSDFVDPSATSAGPALELSGAEPAPERVAAIHELPLQGLGTPYASVQAAAKDLANSSTDARWLVVLTDGEFDSDGGKVSPSELRSGLRKLTGEGISVAYMSIGQDAVTFEEDRKAGLFVTQAATSNDLIGEMTGFTNLIFKRSLAPTDSPTWTPDIPMEEVVLFAQGPGVSVGPAETTQGSVSASTAVNVAWAPNNPVSNGEDEEVPALPNETLEGIVVTYDNVPAGPVTFDVQGARDVKLFYKPQVQFGASLTDSQGNVVAGETLYEGDTYTLDYGFMDSECNIITSPLLGDVEYSAALLQNGTVVEEDLAPGSSIVLPEGDVALDVSASYLGGNSSAAASIALTGSSSTPGAPTAVTAAPKDGAALVSWTEPEYTGGADIVGYSVISDPGNYTCEASGSPSCLVQGLANGTTYTFTVAADNGSGEQSPASDPSNPVTPFQPTLPQYLVSQMGEFPSLDNGIRIAVTVVTEDSQQRPITAEEWANLDPATITIGGDSNLQYEIIKGDQPGDLTLLPRAPDGDVYAATTGNVTAVLTFPAQQKFRESSTEVTFQVVDDISTLSRWTNWFFTTGIKLLLALLVIALILGYVFKRRFPKRIKGRPTIAGNPKTLGVSRVDAAGKFRVNTLRRLMPFVPDRATLVYVPPGVMGFLPMKLKAGPSKTMTLTNWKQIAQRNNTQINGNPLDQDTRKSPIFGAGATVTADTAQVTYELVPSQ